MIRITVTMTEVEIRGPIKDFSIYQCNFFHYTNQEMEGKFYICQFKTIRYKKKGGMKRFIPPEILYKSYKNY